jgi:hypothetical protein
MAHDWVVLAKSSDETRRRLIADWWATQDDSEPAVMLAARRSDVADLNGRARALMAAANKLGNTQIEFDGQTFAAGDRIMTLKNTRRLGVKNGTRGTVESVDEVPREVTIRRDDGTCIKLPRSYLEAGHLTHAYAMTGHKAQGMTTDKAYVLGDQTLYKEWTYVAMSRGRNDNRLYVVGGVDPDREDVGGEVTGIEDPLKELVAAVGRSRAKDLALDSYEHEEIRNLTNTELRQRWEATRRFVDDMPPGDAGRSAQLEAERRRLENMLARQRHLADSLGAELGQMGALERRRNRKAVSDLRQRIDDASEGLTSIEAGLEDIDRAARDVAKAQAQQEQWLLQNAPKVRLLDALGRELWWREQQQALTAEVAMPQYLVNAVGERPMKPSERGAWHEAVKAVESYRDRWAVSDDERALGEEPEVNPDQHFDRETVQRSLEALIDVPSEVEVNVRERSLEL